MDDSGFLIPILIFVMAVLYSSVGHGGASGYLAVLSFFSLLPDEMATTALCLNVLVSSLAFGTFYRAGYFSWSLIWPFIVASIPAAFIGGMIQVPREVYYLILAVVLLYAAFRMVGSVSAKNSESLKNLEAQHEVKKKVKKQIKKSVALGAGAGIGLISGLIGVGGGIFLSPLMVLMKWASLKQTAAVSALFIGVNALSGLLGRAVRGGLVFGELLPYLMAGLAGGLIGSYLGAHRVSDLILRRVLAGVLLIASFKLILYVMR